VIDHILSKLQQLASSINFLMSSATLVSGREGSVILPLNEETLGFFGVTSGYMSSDLLQWFGACCSDELTYCQVID